MKFKIKLGRIRNTKFIGLLVGGGLLLSTLQVACSSGGGSSSDSAGTKNTVVDATPDSTPDSKPDTTPDSKPDTTPDTTPDSKPDTIPDNVPDSTEPEVAVRDVSTFAGSIDKPGFSDGTGDAAKFHAPSGIAVDGNGNLYVADYVNHSIRKLDTKTSYVSTIAGNGTIGSDDGTGTFARFNAPSALTIDKQGNIYVADTGNSRIRKIDIRTKYVSTIAGDTWYFADGTGTKALFRSPKALTMDHQGNIIVADSDNYRIRKIDLSTNYVSTIAGDGQFGFIDGTTGTKAQFGWLEGVVVDSSGIIYVSDTGYNAIRMIDPTTTYVSTYAGVPKVSELTWGDPLIDGPLRVATFNMPRGLAIDIYNNIFVADSNNYAVRKISYRSKYVSAIGLSEDYKLGSITASSYLQYPRDVAVDRKGNVYVTDTHNNRIRVLYYTP